MAKQSLAAQTGTIDVPAPTTQLPAIFGQPAEDIKGRTFGPYVTWAHQNRKDEYKKIVETIKRAPDDMDMFLIEDKSVTHLQVLKCGWLCGVQRWVYKDEKDFVTIISSSSTEKPKPFKEQIECVLLVYLEDRIVVANAQARTTKCPGFKVLSDAAKEVVMPEWPAKSEHHKATLMFEQPFWRFYGNLTVLPPRNSKGGGLPYRPTGCEIVPVGPNEIALIQKFNADPESEKAMNDAAEAYSYRLAEYKLKDGKPLPK